MEGSNLYPEYLTSIFCEGSSSPGELKVTYARKHEVTFLATDSHSPGHLVAIKKYKRKETDKLECLLKTSHANVVNLLDAFLDGETIHFA